MGNASPVVRDSAAIERVATVAAPIVTITEYTNDDGIISLSERVDGVDVRVGLPPGVAVGDTVRVSVSDGITTTTEDIDLTAANFIPPDKTEIFLTPQDTGETLTLAVMSSGRMVLVRSTGVGSAVRFTLLRYFP